MHRTTREQTFVNPSEVREDRGSHYWSDKWCRKQTIGVTTLEFYGSKHEHEDDSRISKRSLVSPPLLPFDKVIIWMQNWSHKVKKKTFLLYVYVKWFKRNLFEVGKDILSPNRNHMGQSSLKRSQFSNYNQRIRLILPRNIPQDSANHPQHGLVLLTVRLRLSSNSFLISSFSPLLLPTNTSYVSHPVTKKTAEAKMARAALSTGLLALIKR